MQKKWHILYTRPGNEKKVAAMLEKRKVEHFLPFCHKIKKTMLLPRALKEPLFDGYVFARVATDELMSVQQASGALSVVYWKQEPATVLGEDILAIKRFTKLYDHIELISVGMNREKVVVENPQLIVDESALSSSKNSDELFLRSLGFLLRADRTFSLSVKTITREQSRESILN